MKHEYYSEKLPLKTFILYRKQDISGISGTGYVAVGVVLPTGKVVIEWVVGDHKSIEIHNSTEDLMVIHGHNGATVLIMDETWDRIIHR